MKKQVLVPLDGTMVAHMALPHAVALARATSSRLILLHVIPPAAGSDAYSLSRAARATATHGHHQGHRVGLSLLHRYLEATAADMEDEGLPVQTEIVEGDPALVIASRAENDPSIWTIVMATRSMSMERSFNRSVTEKVLRTSVPILLVHPDEKMGSLQHFYERAYQTILIPLDGSVSAEQALQPAQMLAQNMGASLLLISVIPDPNVGIGECAASPVSAASDLAGAAYKGSEGGKDNSTAQAERRRAYLSKTAEAIRSGGLAVRAEVAYGTPAEVILRSAASASAGLIVMSTCCRNDLECLLGGNVVRKVAQEAKLPMLLVRAQMAGCPEQREQREQRAHPRLDPTAALAPSKTCRHRS